MTKNIIRYVSVYLIVYLVVLALTFALPFIANGHHQTLLWLSRIVILLPALAMFIMLLCDRKFDIVALVTTLFTGLVTPLLYIVRPNDYRKYAILLSIFPLLAMLFQWIPMLNRYWPSHVSLAVSIAFNILVVVLLALDAKRNEMSISPWIYIIGIVYPACAVLLYYAYSSLAFFKRYIVPTGIVAVLTLVLDVFLIVAPTAIPAEVSTVVKPFLVVLLGVLVCIFMFSDKRLRGIPGRAWLCVTGFFFPTMSYPAAVHCYLDTDTSGLVEELPSEAVE